MNLEKGGTPVLVEVTAGEETTWAVTVTDCQDCYWIPLKH